MYFVAWGMYQLGMSGVQCHVVLLERVPQPLYHKTTEDRWEERINILWESGVAVRAPKKS